MAEYNYMIPVSSTGNATGPASANHLRVPVGPDGVGAFDHRGSTNGMLSAVNFWLLEPQIDIFKPGGAVGGDQGAQLIFNNPGDNAQPLQDLNTLRRRVSGLGPDSNVTLSATVTQSMTGTVVVVKGDGQAWQATLAADKDLFPVGCTELAFSELPNGPRERRLRMLGYF